MATNRMRNEGLSLQKSQLAIPPRELVRWLREEKLENHQHLELFEQAWKHYSFEEDFDHNRYGFDENAHVDLVTVEAVLDIEPLVEQDYWILQVKVTDEIGILTRKEEQAYNSDGLTLDSFEQEFLLQDHQSTEVFVMTGTKGAKDSFARWINEMTSRHGLKH